MIHSHSCVTLNGNIHFISIILLLSLLSTYSICKNVRYTSPNNNNNKNDLYLHNTNYLINSSFNSLQFHFPYSFYNSSPPITTHHHPSPPITTHHPHYYPVCHHYVSLSSYLSPSSITIMLSTSISQQL